MFELKKRFSFDAAHMLPLHGGKCRNLHGHTYTLTLHLRSSSLVSDGPSQGMVLDFEEIERVANPMIKEFLDHRYLNDSLNLFSPTAEAIAKWIYDHLKPSLPLLYKVTLSETQTASVEYCPNC